ncbi:MAG: hypothetical protein KKF80_05735, partial [Candidatus Omnitrophica bacterium]|nr:hypothetical protein [Candidatus Omnitrophota bacterium]
MDRKIPLLSKIKLLDEVYKQSFKASNLLQAIDIIRREQDYPRIEQSVMPEARASKRAGKENCRHYTGRSQRYARWGPDSTREAARQQDRQLRDSLKKRYPERADEMQWLIDHHRALLNLESDGASSPLQKPLTDVRLIQSWPEFETLVSVWVLRHGRIHAVRVNEEPFRLGVGAKGCSGRETRQKLEGLISLELPFYIQLFRYGRLGPLQSKYLLKISPYNSEVDVVSSPSQKNQQGSAQRSEASPKGTRSQRYQFRKSTSLSAYELTNYPTASSPGYQQGYVEINLPYSGSVCRYPRYIESGINIKSRPGEIIFENKSNPVQRIRIKTEPKHFVIIPEYLPDPERVSQTQRIAKKQNISLFENKLFYHFEDMVMGAYGDELTPAEKESRVAAWITGNRKPYTHQGNVVRFHEQQLRAEALGSRSVKSDTFLQVYTDRSKKPRYCVWQDALNSSLYVVIARDHKEGKNVFMRTGAVVSSKRAPTKSGLVTVNLRDFKLFREFELQLTKWLSAVGIGTTEWQGLSPLRELSIQNAKINFNVHSAHVAVRRDFTTQVTRDADFYPACICNPRQLTQILKKKVSIIGRHVTEEGARMVPAEVLGRSPPDFLSFWCASKKQHVYYVRAGVSKNKSYYLFRPLKESERITQVWVRGGNSFVVEGLNWRMPPEAPAAAVLIKAKVLFLGRIKDRYARSKWISVDHKIRKEIESPDYETGRPTEYWIQSPTDQSKRQLVSHGRVSRVDANTPDPAEQIRSVTSSSSVRKEKTFLDTVAGAKSIQEIVISRLPYGEITITDLGTTHTLFRRQLRRALENIPQTFEVGEETRSIMLRWVSGKNKHLPASCDIIILHGAVDTEVLMQAVNVLAHEGLLLVSVKPKDIANGKDKEIKRELKNKGFTVVARKKIPVGYPFSQFQGGALLIAWRQAEPSVTSDYFWREPEYAREPLYAVASSAGFRDTDIPAARTHETLAAYFDKFMAQQGAHDASGVSSSVTRKLAASGESRVVLDSRFTVGVEAHQHRDYDWLLNALEKRGVIFGQKLILMYPLDFEQAEKLKPVAIPSAAGEIERSAFIRWPVRSKERDCNVVFCGSYYDAGFCLRRAFHSILDWQKRDHTSVSYHIIADKVFHFPSGDKYPINDVIALVKSGEGRTLEQEDALRRGFRDYEVAVYLNGTRKGQENTENKYVRIKLYYWMSTDDFINGINQVSSLDAECTSSPVKVIFVQDTNDMIDLLSWKSRPGRSPPASSSVSSKHVYRFSAESLEKIKQNPALLFPVDEITKRLPESENKLTVVVSPG